MIIDDEKDTVDLLKHCLECYGYEVLALSDAKDVIFKLHSFAPDLILLDMLMPEYGGLDACEMLNQDDIGLSTPIIVVSGLAKDTDKKKAYKLGIEEYLVKPVDLNILFSAIERVLKKKNKD